MPSFVSAELSVLWWFRNDFVGRRVAFPLRQVISNTPWRDVTVITWVAFAYGVHQLGFRFASSCFLNVVCVILLRSLIKAKRPIDYDPALRQFANRGSDNYGLPSIETHMAVVVYVQLVGLALAIPLSILIGLSRLVAGSRFPHQVLLSYASGGGGLVLSRFAVKAMPKWQKSWHNISFNRQHFIFWLVATLVTLAFFAHAAESNRSRIFSVPNSEFNRVLRSLYYDAQSTSTNIRAPLVSRKKHSPREGDDSLTILTAQILRARQQNNSL